MNIKYIRTTDKKKYDLRDKRITDTDTGVATQSANGLLSSTDKKKLDGVASGAEVNQNAFSNIKIGNTTIAADGKTDTVELTAGNNITLTPDATNDKITIAATDTNTTYTFAGGTNKFTVTPSNGTAQTVSVTPSIANNVTGSDLTANTIILGNGNSGVKKSGKTIVTTLGSDDTTLPTSKAVKAAIDALPEPMIFKGTLGTGGTITSLPTAAASNEGYTYKVITAGTYASQSAKIGDVFISNGSLWNLIPSGDEPDGTVTNVATGTGLTGGPITSSGTISHADTSSQASVSNSGRTYILSITLDGMGHVTGIASATETIVNTDTKVTQHLANNNANLPILLSTSGITDATIDATSYTIRNNSIYANPSTGTITANKFNGSATHAETSSQSGFVENHGVNLQHYWMKLWEIDSNRKQDDYDITFLLQSSYQEMQGTLHVRIRQNDNGGASGWNFITSMRLTSGNIDKTRVRLYYNNSTGNCQLWYNCGSRWGCINARMLNKTYRSSKEMLTIGTMYSTSTTAQQTLPGTGYEYVEPSYAVISEWDHVQNKPSSYPVAVAQTTTYDNDYPLVWSGDRSTANATVSLLYKSFDRLVYNPSRNWLKVGKLELYPKDGSYTQGIRIHPDSNGWTSLVFCGTDNTGTSGTSANSWSIHTCVGNFYMNRNSAAQLTANRLWGHSNGYTIGNTTESGYNFTVGGTSRFIGTTTTSQIVPASSNTYSIGSSTVEYVNTFSRSVWARHLNASGPYSADKDLYLGYQKTTNIHFYITDADGNNRKRIALFKQDGNAAFDNTVTASLFVGPLTGNATSASKLTTNAGSATQPVYFSGGVPTACSYQLNKTVPSNAVFTDTDTKVTSAANHYTPAEDTSSQLDADASSTTAATWNSTSLVTGVTVKRDAKGHVVGLGVDSIKMPANPNTDNKVCQTLTSANINLPLLMSYNPNTITADTFNLVFRNNSVYANPSTGTITANKFNGNASSASKLTTNAGSTTQPVYFSEGVPTAISYTINKSVPSNAVFTDTHYTTHLYAGSGTAANAATTNGNTKLTVVDNTTTRNSVTIKGTGGTTVTSDANGVVTINSTDISSKQFTFPYPTRSDDGYYFTISPKGNATVTPSGTCYFVEITALINNGTNSYVTRSAKFMTHCYWFNKNAGLRITDPVYESGYVSDCPILYHSHAVGTDVGTETYNYNVCNIPFKLTIETGLMSVNIKVEGPDVSECTCSRSYTSFKWPAVEPDWGAV